MASNRKPTKMQVTELEYIIARLEKWQHRYSDSADRVESAKSRMLDELRRLDRLRNLEAGKVTNGE